MRLRNVKFMIQEKTFDQSKRRVTDLKECSEVFLPKARDEKIECKMEIIRNVIMKQFNAYKKKIKTEIERRNEKKGENYPLEKDQNGNNLSRNEVRGLKKLQKRVKDGEIAIIKKDKSGKSTAILKEDYLKMGKKSNAEDRKVSRKERKEIEK